MSPERTVLCLFDERQEIMETICKGRIRNLCVSLLGILLMLCGTVFSAYAKADTGLIIQKNADGSVTADLFAMDTYMSLKAYGGHAGEAVEAAGEEIKRLDRLMSAEDSASELFALNRDGKKVLSEDLFYLLMRALELSEETDGLFDIAIYPVVKLWGFPTKQYQVPDEEMLAETLLRTDPADIRTDAEKSEVQFMKEGMSVTLGGIAKGYASSRVMDIFREYGVESGLVSLGGNVQAHGKKPGGADWKVAVQDPEGGTDYLGVLGISDKAVITSGGYERYFEENGIRYHHIIDPRTGKPAESGVVSSTIVSADGTLADALSTALYIMGAEKAAAFWRERTDLFDFVLETEDGTLYVTEGIAGQFESGRKTVTVKADGTGI